jgi:hypothetical protein
VRRTTRSKGNRNTRHLRRRGDGSHTQGGVVGPDSSEQARNLGEPSDLSTGRSHAYKGLHEHQGTLTALGNGGTPAQCWESLTHEKDINAPSAGPQSGV